MCPVIDLEFPVDHLMLTKSGNTDKGYKEHCICIQCIIYTLPRMQGAALQHTIQQWFQDRSTHTIIDYQSGRYATILVGTGDAREMTAFYRKMGKRRTLPPFGRRPRPTRGRITLEGRTATRWGWIWKVPSPNETQGMLREAIKKETRSVHLHCTVDSKGAARMHMPAGGQQALGSKHNRGRNRNKAAQKARSD